MIRFKYAIILFLVASIQACSTKVEKEINSVAKACEKPSKEIELTESILLTDSSASETMRSEWKRLYRIFQSSPELAGKIELSAKSHQDKCELARDAIENDKLTDEQKEEALALIRSKTNRVIQINKDIRETSAWVIRFQNIYPELKAKVNYEIEIAGKKLKAYESLSRESAERHPERAGDLEKIKKNLLDGLLELEKVNKNIISILDSDNVDFFRLRQEFRNLVDGQQVLNAIEFETKRLPQLDETYMIILRGMKEEYYVQFSAASWDDWVDWPTIHTKNFAGQIVDKETYRKALAYQGKELKIRNLVKDEFLKKVTGSDFKGVFLKMDDIVEFWLEDSESTFYHQYEVMTDKGLELQDPVEVDMETYNKNVNNIGKAILSKPYGLFDSEAIEVASQPGLAMVGNNHYGEWQQDSSGSNFWVYYGAYRMLGDLMGVSSNGRYYPERDASYSEYQKQKLAQKQRQKLTVGGWGSNEIRPGSKGMNSKGPSVRGKASSFRGRGPAGGK